MIIVICSKCGAFSEPIEAGNRLPKGWVEIRANTSRYGSDNIHYTLCDTCRQKLAIPPDKDEQKDDISTRLLEILEEIAVDAVGDQE